MNKDLEHLEEDRSAAAKGLDDAIRAGYVDLKNVYGRLQVIEQRGMHTSFTAARDEF